MDLLGLFTVIAKFRERILQIACGTIHIGLAGLTQLLQKIKILLWTLTLGVGVQIQVVVPFAGDKLNPEVAELSYVEKAKLIVIFLGDARLHAAVAEMAQRGKVFQCIGSNQLIVHAVDLFTYLRRCQTAVTGPYGIMPAPTIVVCANMTDLQLWNRKRTAIH